MLKWIKVGNKSIEEWVGSTGQHATYIMNDFLSHWGLDINEVRKDRDTRNKVSYRPHFLESEAFSYSYKEYVSNIVELWKLCEPIGSDFGQLDLYILKMSLKKHLIFCPIMKIHLTCKDKVKKAIYLISKTILPR